MTLLRYSKTTMKVIDLIFLYNFGVSLGDDRFDKKLKMEIVYLIDKLHTLKYGISAFEIIPSPNDKDKIKSETINKDNYLDYISKSRLEIFNEVMSKIFFGISIEKIHKMFDIYEDCKLFISQNFMYRPLDMFIQLDNEQLKKLEKNSIPNLFDIELKVLIYNYN